MALKDGGYPLKRAASKVADQKLDAFVAANPELKLDAAAIRAGEKTTVPLEQAVKDKVLTADEAAGATDVTVYSIPASGAFSMFADPAQVNWAKVVGILFILVLYVTMTNRPRMRASAAVISSTVPSAR